MEPDLKPAYYQICAHEGVEKATAWLNQAKAKKAGRNDAMKDLAAALKKEEEATAKKAELHTLKGIKADRVQEAPGELTPCSFGEKGQVLRQSSGLSSWGSMP